MIDYIAYIYYTAYKKKSVNKNEISLHEIDFRRESQTRMALSWSISVIFGLLINFILIIKSNLYCILISNSQLFFILFPILYIAGIYVVIYKRYTIDKLENINARIKNKLPINIARLILLCFALFIFLFVLTIGSMTIDALATFHIGNTTSM